MNMELLIYCCLCTFPAMLFVSHFTTFEEKGLIIVILLIESLVYFFLKKKFKRITLFWTISMMLVIIVFISEFLIGAMYTYNVMVEAYRAGLSFYLFRFPLSVNNLVLLNKYSFLFITIIFSFSIGIYYRCFIVKKNNYLTLFWLLLSILSSLIIQIRINWVMMTFIFILIGALLLPSFKIELSKKIRIKQFIFLASAIILSTSVFINEIPEYRFKQVYNINSAKEETFEAIAKFFQKFSYFQHQDEGFDLNNANNRVYANVKHLTIQREIPKSLYLKTFSAAVYEENQWKILPEANYSFKYQGEKIDYRLVSTPLEIGYYPQSHVETIEIEDFREGSKYALQPYFIQSIHQPYSELYDCGIKINEDKISYGVWKDGIEGLFFSYAASRYCDFLLDNYLSYPTSFESIWINQLQMKSNDEIKEKYMDKITDDLTINPEGELAFDQGYINDVTHYITSILDDYTYTLKPGSLPPNKDFIEYFLTENKKGYCVHFASAATLMFRYYGIPARYVEGYFASYDKFNRDGYAEVLDSDAHAWVEVFVENKGWTPIEVTVGKKENTDSNDVNRPNNPNNSNTERPTTPTDKEDDRPNQIEIDQEETTHAMNFDFDKLINILIPMIVILGYMIYHYLIIIIRKNKFKNENRQQAVFEYAKYLNKIDCQYPVIDEECQRIFEKNKYSTHFIDNSEFEYIKKIAKIKPKEIYKNLSLKEKIVFKYLKHWL